MVKNWGREINPDYPEGLKYDRRIVLRVRWKLLPGQTRVLCWAFPQTKRQLAKEQKKTGNVLFPNRL